MGTLFSQHSQHFQVSLQGDDASTPSTSFRAAAETLPCTSARGCTQCHTKGSVYSRHQKAEDKWKEMTLYSALPVVSRGRV